MPIAGQGWELHVERLAVHRKGSRRRTFGRYQVYVDGIAQVGLSGFVCEAPGPGDNSTTGKNKRRVEAGRYQLFTQFGKYRSLGYAKDTQPAGATPMPGFRLENRGVRTDILVHPGHPPTLYLSSIGCLNLTEEIDPGEFMNYWDSRRRVIALLESLKTFAPTAFAHEVVTKIVGACAVIDGEPVDGAPAIAMAGAAVAVNSALALAVPASLPISEAAARTCAAWLMQNYRAELIAAVQGKPYGVQHLAAIVCQETAYKWIPWIATQSPATILARAVYDASGDYPGTTRGAFPKTTSEFRQRFGAAFANMLIDEANQTRALQGWKPAKWVYKGYGLFQYDLQHVLADQSFFEQKQWYNFNICVRKCTAELDRKLVQTHGDLWKAIRAYNGTGAKAQQYMENVRYFTSICADVVEETEARFARAAGTLTTTLDGVALAPARKLSGPHWISRFPDGGKVEDLEPVFGAACSAFITALRAGGATVEIHSTRRPRERAYLMNAAWRIAREGIDPRSIEAFPAVDIEWAHTKQDGTYDPIASRKAASAMVVAYDIAFKPALNSNHIAGNAIDMSIRWRGSLTVADARRTAVKIDGTPRSGMHPTLWQVGKSYGVRKLPSDPPHWSANGR